METRLEMKRLIAIAATATFAVGVAATASDFGQSFYLSAPDSNPASAVRFGEPAGTPPPPPPPSKAARLAAAPAVPTPPVDPAPPDLAAAPEPPADVDPAVGDEPRVAQRVREEARKLAAESRKRAEDSALLSAMGVDSKKLAADGRMLAESAQREVQKAVEEIRRSTKDGKRVSMAYDGRRRARTLLLPADTATGETREHLNEDLAVMHRILARASGRKKDADTFRIAFDRPDSPELDAMYLDGYGAVFLLSVNFPLVEPPKAKAKDPAADAAKDDVWEDTRRKLRSDAADLDDGFGRGAIAGAGSGYGGGGVMVNENVVGFVNGEVEPFDSEKVAALKKKVSASLKHAANIRDLKPDESVVVVINGRGSGAPGATKITRTIAIDDANAARRGVPPITTFHLNEGGEGGQARMIFRVKKSDVDALAEGKISAEQLPVKISVTNP